MKILNIIIYYYINNVVKDLISNNLKIFLFIVNIAMIIVIFFLKLYKPTILLTLMYLQISDLM